MIGDGLGAERAFAASLSTGPEQAVQFGVLGPLQMRIGGALVPLGTPKQRAVLAVLIVNTICTVLRKSMRRSKLISR